MEERIKQIVWDKFNARTIKVRRITEGYTHYMYDVTINNPPYEIIIRFSKNIKEDVNIAKEKYVIETLSKNGIPTPEIYQFYYPEEKKEEGYIILEKFKDIRLDTIWNQLSKQEKIQMTKELGNLLSKIHKIKLPKYGWIQERGEIKSESEKNFEFRDQGEKIKYSLFLNEVLTQTLKDIARLISYKIINPKFISDFTLFISQNLDKIDFNEEPTFIHGDFMTGHIFVEKINGKYKIKGLIDFEFAAALSPEYDFIKLHRQGFFEDEELKNALNESYGKIDEKAVEIHRLMRDISFAMVLLKAGNKELSGRIIKEVWKKIKFFI